MIKLNRQSTLLAAFALALGMSAGAMAQSTGASGSKISRQAYMDEVGRRWDAADASKQGLTTDEINRMYWNAGVGMGGPTATQPNQKKGLQQ
jgi:hypothetical protein